MSVTTCPAARTWPQAGRKSPLRTATIGGRSSASAHGLATADFLAAEVTQSREAIPAPQLWRMQISDFTDWLRSRTNKHHWPCQADTIAAYCDAARALSEWMSGHDVNGDFIACDTALSPCSCRRAPSIRN